MCACARAGDTGRQRPDVPVLVSQVGVEALQVVLPVRGVVRVVDRPLVEALLDAGAWVTDRALAWHRQLELFALGIGNCAIEELQESVTKHLLVNIILQSLSSKKTQILIFYILKNYTDFFQLFHTSIKR